MAPAPGRELPFDFRERNPVPTSVGAFGFAENARQSAILQQLGEAREIIFGHNDKALAASIRPDFGFQFQHVSLQLIIGLGAMHDAMHDQ
jgi:hypothetical protein